MASLSPTPSRAPAGSTGKQKSRRRTLIVNKPIQAQIMLNAALLPVLILVLNTVLVGSFCWSLSQEASHAGVKLPSTAYLIAAAGTFLLVSVAFVAIYVLLLSHRIAGPMYAISKVMAEVQSGAHDKRCQLRKLDLLWPLSDDVNSFLDWLEEEHLKAPVVPEDSGSTDAEPGPAAAAELLTAAAGRTGPLES